MSPPSCRPLEHSTRVVFPTLWILLQDRSSSDDYQSRNPSAISCSRNPPFAFGSTLSELQRFLMISLGLVRVAEKLAQVLLRASYLEKLSFMHAEFFFPLSETAKQSLSSLPRLTSLNLHDADYKTVDALQMMNSPTIDLEIESMGGQDLLPSFRTLCSTLTDLTLYWMCAKPTVIACPCVRRIWWNCLGYIDHMDAVVFAFPNLSYLALEMTPHGYHNPDPDLAGTIRSRNRNAISALAKPWKSLETLQGGLAHLYLLGLSCQVDKLVIQYAPHTGLPMLLQLLADLQPRAFSMCYSGLTLISLEDSLALVFDRLSRRCHFLQLNLAVEEPLKYLRNLYVSTTCFTEQALRFVQPQIAILLRKSRLKLYISISIHVVLNLDQHIKMQMSSISSLMLYSIHSLWPLGEHTLIALYPSEFESLKQVGG